MEQETASLPVCFGEKRNLWMRWSVTGLSHEPTHHTGRKTSHLFILLEETNTLSLFRPASAVTLLTFHMHSGLDLSLFVCSTSTQVPLWPVSGLDVSFTQDWSTVHDLYLFCLFTWPRFIVWFYQKITKFHPYWQNKLMTKFICKLVRLMAYRHSLNKKNTKTATLAPRLKADPSGKILSACHNTGWWIVGQAPPEFSLLTIQWLKGDGESVYAWMVLLALKAM